MRKSIFARMVPVFLGLMCLGQSAHSQGDSHKDFFNPQMLWQSPGQSSVQSRAEKAVVSQTDSTSANHRKSAVKSLERSKQTRSLRLKDRQDDGGLG